MTAEVIRLAELSAPLPRLDLGDGRTVALRRLSGVGLQLVLEAQRSQDMTRLYEALCGCLPDLSRDEVFAFDLEQVGKLVGLAAGSALEVLAQVGKDSAAVTTASPPATAPAISSASS